MPKAIDPDLLKPSSYLNLRDLDTHFGDMDILGHINNVAIVRYYENARARFLLDIFGDKKHYTAGEYNFVIAEYAIKFLGETHFPELVTVGTAITALGSSSCQVQQAIFQEGQCVGLCHTAMVLVQRGKPLTLPNTLREGLQGFMLHS